MNAVFPQGRDLAEIHDADEDAFIRRQAFAFEPPFPAHALMHGANKFGLASLCNLDQLPPTGAVLITAPLKIENGSGSPLRVLALVDDRDDD